MIEEYHKPNGTKTILDDYFEMLQNDAELYNASSIHGYNGTNSTGANDSMTIPSDASMFQGMIEKYQKYDIFNIKETSPRYTICGKMSVSEEKTIIQYLFDEGKCGKVCRKGILKLFIKLILL